MKFMLKRQSACAPIQGQYRPALVKLLQLIYTGHDRPTSLQELTGQDFADLDRQYQEFIAKLPNTLNFIPMDWNLGHFLGSPAVDS